MFIIFEKDKIKLSYSKEELEAISKAKEKEKLFYTEKELEAISKLKKEKEPKTCSELGIPNGIIISLIRKQVRFEDNENVVKIEQSRNNKNYRAYKIVE